MEIVDDTNAPVEVAARTRDPRRVQVFSLALFATALLIGAGLLAAGAALPAPGPVLLLAIAAALCVNRFALFPTEHAATAEAAVLLAAVVGFRHDAILLGPLLVGLLVGPLDALHWEQRSFVRMAYNAGNRGVSALAAATAFVVARDLLGTAPVAWCLTVVVASLAFTVVDNVVLSTALLRLHGEPATAALRHVLDVDSLALPIAWYGAAVGLLAGAVGWWATALALLPAAFLPELVIAQARRHARVARDASALVAVGALLATLSLVLPVPSAATVVVFAAIAVLAGVEFAVDRHTAVPPMIAMAVVAAVLVVDGDRARFTAAFVAVAATATSWVSTRAAARPQLLIATAIALGGGLLAAQVALEPPRTVTGIALGALAAGIGFQMVAVVAGGDRRRRSLSLLWTAPLLGVAAGGAMAWRSLGLEPGAPAFTVGCAAALAGAIWWGAPAWRSRVLQPAIAPRSARLVGVALLAAALGAVLAAIVGVVADHTTAVGWAWVSTGFGEGAVAMTAMGVRQWRFAPRPRVFGLGVLLVASAALVTAGPGLVIAGSWWGPGLVAIVMLVVTAIARQPARRARAFSEQRDRTRNGVP